MKLLYIACAFDGGKSGISVYMRETLSRLCKSDDVTVLCCRQDLPILQNVGNARFEVLSSIWTRSVFNMFYVSFLAMRRFRNAGFDALLLPAANRRTVWRCPLHSVGVVHDLSQYHVPAKYDPFRMFYIRFFLPHAARCLDRVAAISQSTAGDLVRYWKLNPERISIIYNGFDRKLFPREASPSDPGILERYHLKKEEYILYVSRIEHPGKNHLRLIQAYEQLPESVREKYLLVFGGSRWNGANAVFDYAEKSPCRERIRFIGFVPYADLAVIYRGARAYCFPSLFEGFGLSLPEAMSCGTVCCCSNNSSLGEIGGDAALQFNPESVSEISRAVRAVLEEEKLRSDLRKRGFERIRRFDWDFHVIRLRELLTDRCFRHNHLLGISYDNVTMGEALALIDTALKTKIPRKAAFVNADCFNQGCENPQYRKILSRFDWVFPDGSGVRLAGKWLNFPVRDNVNGTDMLPLLVKLAEKKGYRIFLYGARPGVADTMRRNLLKEYPRLDFAGVCDGYVPVSEAVEQISAARPDLLLVALGVPRQEFFIEEHFAELHAGVVLGVGGLFDFYSGRIPRAPRILRKLGLEWVFRLAMEPRRMFRRYVIGNPLFLLRVIFRHS